jgi:hypothetical protein
MDNNIDESEERRKRKVPLRFGGGDITPTNLTIQDEYHLAIVILCEKLFLTKTFLIEDELKEIARFYDFSYDDLRAEERLYKIALDEKKNGI